MRDNVLGLTRRVCGGQQSCRFDYDVDKLGDPAGRCDKRIQILNGCGSGAQDREFLIARFNRNRMPVELRCK